MAMKTQNSITLSRLQTVQEEGGGTLVSVSFIIREVLQYHETYTLGTLSILQRLHSHSCVTLAGQSRVPHPRDTACAHCLNNSVDYKTFYVTTLASRSKDLDALDGT